MVQCNQDVFFCKNNTQVFLLCIDPGYQPLRFRITDLLFLIRETNQKIGIAVQLQEDICKAAVDIRDSGLLKIILLYGKILTCAVLRNLFRKDLSLMERSNAVRAKPRPAPMERRKRTVTNF